MFSGYLEHSTLCDLVEAAHAVSLRGYRETLFMGLPPSYINTFADAPSITAQTMQDLHKLNTTKVLLDGTIPLVAWLRNLTLAFNFSPEVQVFKDALEQVHAKIETLSELKEGDASDSPRFEEVIEKRTTVLITAKEGEAPACDSSESVQASYVPKGHYMAIRSEGLLGLTNVQLERIEKDSILYTLEGDGELLSRLKTLHEQKSWEEIFGFPLERVDGWVSVEAKFESQDEDPTPETYDPDEGDVGLVEDSKLDPIIIYERYAGIETIELPEDCSALPEPTQKELKVLLRDIEQIDWFSGKGDPHTAKLLLKEYLKRLEPFTYEPKEQSIQILQTSWRDFNQHLVSHYELKSFVEDSLHEEFGGSNNFDTDKAYEIGRRSWKLSSAYSEDGKAVSFYAAMDAAVSAAMNAAEIAAGYAALDAAGYAAGHSALDAARNAARNSTLDVARTSALSVALDAALDATLDAAGYAALDAARSASLGAARNVGRNMARNAARNIARIAAGIASRNAANSALWLTVQEKIPQLNPFLPMLYMYMTGVLPIELTNRGWLFFFPTDNEKANKVSSI